MMRRLTAGMLAVLAGCGPVDDGDLGQAVASRRDAVLGGSITYGEPEVFALLCGSAMCSSTLIGRRTLLTAAHCVIDDSGRTLPATACVATNVTDAYHARSRDMVGVSAIRSHSQFVLSDLSGGNDIAMVQLARDPPAPVKPWNTEPIEAFMQTEMRIVGYGVTAKEGSGDGYKRAGVTTLRGVSAKTFTYGVSGQSGACQGDSGGPGLHRFPDGSERVIGITSFDDGRCGRNTDTRVDAFVSYIQAGLVAYEASCAEDGRCKSGCTPVDVDCACTADGACNAGCSGLALDPDCPQFCGADTVCTTTTAACSVADPDCQVVGVGCGYEAHCASRLCITSAQHPKPYCSKACAASADCPAGLDCVSSRCEYKVLPVATVGQPCTQGATFCDGPSLVCAGWAKDPETKCRVPCFSDIDCTGLETCRLSPQAPGVCVPNVTLPLLANETYHPPSGCTAAPGLLLPALLTLVGLRRRSR